MSLLERLEAKRREMDRRVMQALPYSYDPQAADMRELLDETIAAVRSLSLFAAIHGVRGVR